MATVRHITAISLMFFILFLSGITKAVPISDQVRQKLTDEGRLDKFITRYKDFHENHGWDQPGAYDYTNKGSAATAAASGDRHILVILIDFWDNQWTSGWDSVDPEDFDTLIFSEGIMSTGSMREYYLENSYGSYEITGVVTQWYRASLPHAYYNGILDDGEDPDFSRSPSDLVTEALLAADADYDFADFDSNNDNYIDGVIVIHAGTGYEESGDTDDIHSHMSSVGGSLVFDDNIRVKYYTLQPEESDNNQAINGIGVLCHEWGHVLGLPDLYDIDYSCEGVGRWSLMASGNYNGNSESPAHFDAWCKKELGWINIDTIEVNTDNVEIPAVEYSNKVYYLNKEGRAFSEYWLVENRQKMGFDSALPGEGLLIYHVDESETDNTNDWGPLVMVEQADGEFDLQYSANRGDGADPFPGTYDIREFNDKTTPNSRYNGSDVSSQVAIWNISDPDSIMTVDIEVTFSRPWIEASYVGLTDVAYGDGDGIFEAGERIQAFLVLGNDWADATDIAVTMATNDPDLTLIVDYNEYGDLAGGEEVLYDAVLFEFDIPAEISSRIDSLYFDLTSNDDSYATSFGTEIIVGHAQVLIVDDDGGSTQNLEQYVENVLYADKVPTMVWDKSIAGSPKTTDLTEYNVVIWLTGDYRDQLLTEDDIDALEGFLSEGRKLFLNGQGIASQLHASDSAFLADYLRATYRDSTFDWIPLVLPMEGAISTGAKGIAFSASGAYVANQTVFDHIYPANGSIGEWKYHDMGQGEDYGIISYSDENYKLVYSTFGFESIISNRTSYESQQTLMTRIMDFFGALPTDVADGDDMAINLPAQISLEQNYPNPFNPITNISYTITGISGNHVERTQLAVYNVIGQKVITLVDRYESPGKRTVTWDGRDDNGRPIASGIYFYRIIRGDMTQTRKMILMK